MEKRDSPRASSETESGELDVSKALEALIGETGTMVPEYGGFVITVTDNRKFPWYDVFNILVGKVFEVWVDRKNGDLIIVSKQKTD